MMTALLSVRANAGGVLRSENSGFPELFQNSAGKVLVAFRFSPLLYRSLTAYYHQQPTMSIGNIVLRLFFVPGMFPCASLY